MKNTTELHKLIKSLKKSEKNYFISDKIMSIPNSLYARIFNETVNAEVYDEDIIMKRLGITGKNNFSVAKNYLYTLILASLEKYYSGSNSDKQIISQIAAIEILYKKTFFPKAYELLKKVKKKAYNTDNFVRVLELIKWERNLVIEGIVKGNNLENLSRLFDEESNVLNKIKNVSEYRLLASRLNAILNGKDNSSSPREHVLKELKKHPLVKDERNALSFAALAAYYSIHSIIARFENKNIDVYANRKKLVHLLESRNDILKENPTNYVISVHNFINICYDLKYFDEMEYYIKKLREAADVLRIPENAGLLLDFTCTKFEVQMFTAQCNYKAAFIAAAKLMEVMTKFKGKISLSDEMESYYIIINLYFTEGRYGEALKYLNYTLTLKHEQRTEEILFTIRLINIIIHYELKNIELLDYLAKAFMKYLRKSKKSKGYAKIISEIINGMQKGEENELKELFNRIEKIILEEYQNNNDHIAYNSMRNWIKSKT